MPKRTDDTPVMLRPFVAHGMDLSKFGTDEAEGTCVFCGSVKFYVGLTKSADGRRFPGGWWCQKCTKHGNVLTWLSQVWECCAGATSDAHYEQLAADRGLSPEVLRLYGLARSFTGEWIVPGYCINGSVGNLYRYKPLYKPGGEFKRTLMATPGGELNPGYFRPTDAPENHDVVEYVEGVWNACARRDSLLHADPDRAARTLVVGTPGANTWVDGWAGMAGGRYAAVMMDNDHPKSNPKTGTVVQSGWKGTQRAVTAILKLRTPALSVGCLVWGEGGYDPTLPDGYDLRDVCTAHNGTAVSFVDARLAPPPAEWASTGKGAGPGTNRGTQSVSSSSVGVEKCESWEELKAAWKPAILLTSEMESVLTFALCVGAAVTYGENRLWGRVIGAPSSGKSMICAGLSASTRYCVTESVLPATGFYSGTITKDGEDHSFANRLWDRCWVNNDADTLRTQVSREVVFAQMRDLYGGKGSKVFHNGVGSRSYEGLRFGVLFAGTEAIYDIDASELGARFLDLCVAPPSREDRMKMAFRAMERQSSGGSDQSGMSPTLKRATQMTGGYLEHLRQKYDGTDPAIRLTDEVKTQIYLLSEYVTHLQSRPSEIQDEHQGSVALPIRVSTQLTALAVYAALVRGSTKIDLGAMRLTRRVAINTAEGRSSRLVRAVAACGDDGYDIEEYLPAKGMERDREWKLVNHLCHDRVKVLEPTDRGVPSVTRRVHYRLHPEFRQLYDAVFGGGDRA